MQFVIVNSAIVLHEKMLTRVLKLVQFYVQLIDEHDTLKNKNVRTISLKVEERKQAPFKCTY